MRTSSDLSVKNKAALHAIFPAFTSSSDLEAIATWSAKKTASLMGMKATDSGILLPKEELVVSDEFDIRTLMKEAEDPLTGTLRDLKVDDRDLPLAKNFYDFSFNIIGKDSNPPWARQLWTGAMLFGEICPCCSNKKWLEIENVPKDYKSKDLPENLMFLNNGKCPKCKRTKQELIKDHGLKNYMELVLVWGQRSGKSESAAFFSAYQTHKFLKFPKLSTLTHALQASTPLTATFVSLTFTKAVSLLWTPLFNKISSSTWFKDYHKMLDFYGNKQGVELYRVKDLFIKYHHKGLHLYPSHPNGPILRGDTRYLAVVDELGLFPMPSGNDEEDEQSERANSDEAHKSLTNSLTTVQAVSQRLLERGYNAVPAALMMGVSSPMSERDKVMRLLKESKTEEGAEHILGIQLPTWEVNPYIGRDTPIIVRAYARNAAKAERDFGANPPRVHSTFMAATAVEGVFIGNSNSHSVSYMWDLADQIYAKLNRLNSIKHPCVMSLDAGYSDNAFALSAGYFDFDSGKTVLPTVLEVVPQQKRKINFNRIYKHVILPLMIDCNCVLLLADRWNSIDLLHRATDDRGLGRDGKPITINKQYSPKRRHFEQVRTMMENKNLILPSFPKEDQKLVLETGVENFKVDMLDKPVAHLMLQCVTVKDTNNKLPPEKGEGYTDDIWRSVVLTAALIHEPKVLERLKNAKIAVTQATAHVAPTFRGRSGGSGFYPGLR